MKTVLHSDDISCGGCTASIEKALSAVPGVVSVSGDPATKLVAVEHDDTLSVEAIISKMDETGFESKVVAQSPPLS